MIQIENNLTDITALSNSAADALCSFTIDEYTSDNESFKDKYADYIHFSANGIEYAAHPKLVQEYHAPEIDRNTLSERRKAYDNNENIKVLRILGFDLSKNRKQGTDWVSEKKISNGITILEPTWYWFSSNEIALGRQAFLKGDKEKLGQIINPLTKGLSVFYTNEFAIYNRYIPRPNKYKAFPRHIAENINRFNNKAVGLSQHPNTRSVMFDIDNHNFEDLEEGIKESDRVLNQLYAELGFTIESMIERSAFGSYHVSYLTTDYVKDSDMTAFVERFNKKHNAHIETRLTTKIFRIPGHFTYNLGYTTIEDGKVIFVPFNPESAFDDYRNKVFAAEASDDRLDYSVFETTYKYSQYSGTDSNLYKRDKILNKSQTPQTRPGDKYQLRPGDRNNNMIKMACSMQRSSCSFEQYLDELNYANHGSRDWSSWSSEEKRTSALQAWKNADKYISECGYAGSYISDTFYSSMNYIPVVLLPILKDKQVISQLANIKVSSYGKNKERIISDTGIVLEELIGKMFHECANPRQVYADVPAELKTDLESAYQFPRKFFEHMKKHNNMKSDIKGIARNILNNKALFKQYKHNKLGYRFKSHKDDVSFCKQFYIKGANPDSKDANVLTAVIILALRPLYTAQGSGSIDSEGDIINLNMCQVLENDSIIFAENEAQFYRCSSPPDDKGVILTQMKPEVIHTLH